MSNIDKLELNVRSYCTLLRAGIDSIEMIDNLRDSDLLEIPHFNKKCLKEVREKMRTYKAGKHYECRFCDCTRAVPYAGEPDFLVCGRCGAEWMDCRILVPDMLIGM